MNKFMSHYKTLNMNYESGVTIHQFILQTYTCRRAWVMHLDNPHVRMPLGALGELLLEGPSLARGYHQNPGATFESFIDHLRWAEPGRRFYRTGDLVRANPDGSFTYNRRRDYQVKFRGIRIEKELNTKV
jgi:acyl-CoA synthetase (AMP-forming)/AMP-acid ligase II